MKIRVFTHCDIDALGCVFALGIKYGFSNVTATYHTYGNINKSVYDFLKEEQHLKYDKVFITDISLSEKMCEWINKDYLNLFTLIDHHITNSTDYLKKYKWVIRELNKINYVEEELTSATYLVADYLGILGQTRILDDIIIAIDRYDTWLWTTKYSHKMSKDLNDLYYIYGRDLLMEKLIKEYNVSLEKPKKSLELDDTSLLLLSLRENEYKGYLRVSQENLNVISIKNPFDIDKELKIGVVFAEKFISELGNDLVNQNEDLDLIALINFRTGVSLRTVKDNVHLGELANQLAEHIDSTGGGHSKSSGYRIPKDLLQNIISKIIK